MLDEFRKSINSTLHQRITSPLYGTIIVTWLIWNWKIWYVTIFVSEDKLSTNKLDFIVTNYSNPLFLVYLPLISTLFILTVVQFISNGAFWLDVKFMSWRVNNKNQIEGKQLLTLEQSIKLRTEIREQELNFDKLLEKKNAEIEILNRQITELQTQLKSNTTAPETTEEKKVSEESKERKPRNSKTKEVLGSNYSSGDYNRLSKNKEIYKYFENVSKNIRDKDRFPNNTPEEVKEFFIANELVQSDQDAIGNPIYKLTFRGRELYKEYYNRTYIDQ